MSGKSEKYQREIEQEFIVLKNLTKNKSHPDALQIFLDYGLEPRRFWRQTIDHKFLQIRLPE